MGYRFKEHKLSNAEKLWLLEAAKAPDFEPRATKVLLRDKLPPDFAPNNIEYRFYANGKLMLLGLYLVDPDNPMFKTMDVVIRNITSQIISNPRLERIKAADIAVASGISESEVSAAFGHLSELGRFYSGASGAGGHGLSELTLQGDDSYDEYLRYLSLDDLLERQYTREAPSKQNYTLAQSSIFHDAEISRNERMGIKENTAFVLMAINPSNATLEDTYNTIKETSLEFGITAYRADEIEHQGQITEQILLEIQTAEYLIADLSYERPNVYYEIGYAHAMNKKPILYRAEGTKLHFDLLVHNVPEYKNNTELRTLLRRRWEAILGRSGKEG